MSVLKQVLHYFDHRTGPASLSQMARDLDLDPATLDGMLTHWVRKGKLRETGANQAACTTCGHGDGCPFVVQLPRSYERVTGDSPPEPSPPCSTAACSRCG